MAKVVRGEGGKPHESDVVVRLPHLSAGYPTKYLVDYEPEIVLSVAEGQQVTITMPYDEAL